MIRDSLISIASCFVILFVVIAGANFVQEHQKQAEQQVAFGKFLAEKKCKLGADLGKPVFVEEKNAMGALPTPQRFQKVYSCEDFPFPIFD